jgi:hypothetical protein
MPIAEPTANAKRNRRRRERAERARARQAQRAAQLRAAAQQRNEPRETRKRTPGHADPLARHLGSYGTPRERTGAIYRLLHQLQEHEDRLAELSRRQAMYETLAGRRTTALAARQRIEPGIGLSQPERLFQEEEQRREASRAAAIAGPDIGVPIVARAAGQLAESILYAPAGVYELAKAVGLDVGDIATEGDLTPERTAELAKAIGLQIGEDVRHPGRNPGYLFADVLGAVGGGVGATARLGTGVRAAGQAGRHAGTRTIRRRYDAELGRVETLAEALETSLKRGEAVPEALLAAYAGVAKRYAGGTTSRTRAFGRGVARPSKRSRDLIERDKGPLGRMAEKDRAEIEADIRSVLDEPAGAKRPGVREEVRTAAAASRAHPVEALVREASDAARAGIVYLRPAYIPNNVTGNLFFNLIQQGFLAPVNLAKSFALNKRMGKRETGVVDGAMGQSAAQAIHGGGPGIVRAATRPVVEGLSKVADRPFRRAAFLHEARRAGYRTLADVKALIREAEQSPRKMRELVEIARKANDEIVRFGKLSETERLYLRHLFFIWSWTKGASRYAGRFPLAHPIATAATVQLGREGEEQVEDVLGDVPDWLRGYIPIDVDEDGNPRLVNPTSLTPLGTGLDVARAAIGTAKLLAGGKIEYQDRTALELFNPLVRLPFEALRGGKPVPEALAESVAAVRLARALAGKDTGGKTFPGSRAEEIARFVVGSLYPRKASRETIREQAEREHPLALAQRLARRHSEELAEEEAVARRMGRDLPESVRGAIELRDALETARELTKERLDVEKLTDYQALLIELEVIARMRPDLADEAAERRADLQKYRGKPNQLNAYRSQVVYHLAFGELLQRWGTFKSRFERAEEG